MAKKKKAKKPDPVVSAKRTFDALMAKVEDRAARRGSAGTSSSGRKHGDRPAA